jgi:hypothetical protein
MSSSVETMPAKEWCGRCQTQDMESDQTSGKSNIHCLKRLMTPYVSSVEELIGNRWMVPLPGDELKGSIYLDRCIDVVAASEGLEIRPGVVAEKGDRSGDEVGIRVLVDGGVES